MKKTILLLLGILATSSASAQKFGYIDSEFILKKMPDYTKAQQEIASLAAKWEGEIQGRYAEVAKLQEAFRAEEILLTDALRKQRQDTIQARLQGIQDYQRRVFGYEGMLFLKKQEIIKPVQDKIYEAVQKVVSEKKLNFMFDKAGDLTMLYTDPRHDYTDYVLEALGLGDREDTVPKR